MNGFVDKYVSFLVNNSFSSSILRINGNEYSISLIIKNCDAK